MRYFQAVARPVSCNAGVMTRMSLVAMCGSYELRSSSGMASIARRTRRNRTNSIGESSATGCRCTSHILICYVQSANHRHETASHPTFQEHDSPFDGANMSRKIIDRPRLVVSGVPAEVCKVLSCLTERLALSSTSEGSSSMSSGPASHLHETRTEGIPALAIASIQS